MSQKYKPDHFSNSSIYRNTQGDLRAKAYCRDRSNVLEKGDRPEQRIRGDEIILYPSGRGKMVVHDSTGIIYVRSDLLRELGATEEMRIQFRDEDGVAVGELIERDNSGELIDPDKDLEGSEEFVEDIPPNKELVLSTKGRRDGRTHAHLRVDCKYISDSSICRKEAEVLFDDMPICSRCLEVARE